MSKARYSRTDDTGGRRRRRRDDATGELKRAIAGREHEFSGLLLIVGGVILAAGVFFKVAGILGDGVDTLVGSLAGLARYVVPFVLIAMGIAFIRRSRTSSPWRLLFGWTFVALAILGILHVARGPQGFSVNGVTKAGGVLGWAVGEPLRTLVEDFGAYVLFGAVGLFGAMLITQASLRTMAQRTGHAAQRTGRGVGAVAAPLGRAARQALRDLSSLNSDKDPDADQDRENELDPADDDQADVGTVALALPPVPYDAGDDLYGDDESPPRGGRARRGPRCQGRAPHRRTSPEATTGRCRPCRCCIARTRRPSTVLRSRLVAGCSGSRCNSTGSTRPWPA